MNDERYVFVSDVKEKKSTARSARNKRTHCGKGGSIKFPSDYLSKKELNALNSEVKAYRLNDPMKWDEFKSMPDDLRADYIKLLREKFGVPNVYVAEMLGVHVLTLQREINRLSLNTGKGSRGKLDEERWRMFIGGAKETEEPVAESEAAPEQEAIPVCEEKQKTIPRSGSVSFVGAADEALATMSALLGNANVKITVYWDVNAGDGLNG